MERTASRMFMTSTPSKIAGTTQTPSTSRFKLQRANATSCVAIEKPVNGPYRAASMATSFWRDLESSSFQSSPQPSVQQNQRSPGASDAATMNPTYRSTSSSRMCSKNVERSTSSSACRWRILQITRLLASDSVRDSAAAIGMKQRLMASVLHLALAAGLPSPSARDVY